MIRNHFTKGSLHLTTYRCTSEPKILKRISGEVRKPYYQVSIIRNEKPRQPEAGEASMAGGVVRSVLTAETLRAAGHPPETALRVLPLVHQIRTVAALVDRVASLLGEHLYPLFLG